MALEGQPYPVYLVVAPFSELAPSVRVLLRTLDKLVPHLPLAEAYYRDDTDEALIGLHFDRPAVDRLGEDTLLAVVRRCQLPVIVPDRLEADKRADFTRHHLSTYHTYVQQYRAPDSRPSLLERLLVALEEHVDGTGMAEWDYEDVEVVRATVRARTSSERATSQWEVDAPRDDASEPDALI